MEIRTLDIIGFSRVLILTVGLPKLRNRLLFMICFDGPFGVCTQPYVGRLVGLDVLRKVNRGRYKLNKAPIIAYYHALERQIITGK